MLCISAAGFCQGQPVAHAHLINKTLSDTIRVNELNELAKVHQWKSPEKSKTYAREAYQLAIRLNYTNGASYALWKLGSLFQQQGNYNKALYYFLESIRLQPPGENSIAKAHAFGSIANLYINLKQFKLAETYLNESSAIFKNKANQLGIAISDRRMGFLQLSQHQLRPAMQHFSSSLALMQSLQDTVGIGYATAFIGEVYFEQKKYKQALAEYTRALALQDKIGNYAEKASLLIYIGKIYTQTGQFTKATESYQQAIALATDLDFKPALQESYQNLAALYKKQGNLKEALYYHEQFLGLHNEIFSEETMENIADLHNQYQRIEKEQEIELLKKEREIQRLQITKSTYLAYFFLAILLLLLLVSSLLYSRYILKKKANLTLQVQNQAIREQSNKIEHQNTLLLEAKNVIETQNQLLESDKVQLEVKVREKTNALMDAYSHLLQVNEELDILVYKSSHDLRGPLATMLGVCNIAFMDIKDKAALSYFRMLQKNATRLDALLHRLLKVNHVKHAEIHSLWIQPNELITEVIETVAATEGFKDMHFYMDIESDFCIYSDADLIKTILENVLQNSIHYRLLLPDASPAIWLNVYQYGDAMRIVVKDNGIGIEEAYVSKIFTIFSKGNIRSQGSGLGLYIAKAAVTKIQGSIRYCDEVSDGTAFEIIIPNLDGKPVLHPLQVVNQA